MEDTDSPIRMNYTVKKDGSLSGDLADRDQFQLLERYILRTLGKMVEDIASGNVDPNPYTRGSSHSVRSYDGAGQRGHSGPYPESEAFL
jgi:ATP-dependent helicase/DNAse subunit B